MEDNNQNWDQEPQMTRQQYQKRLARERHQYFSNPDDFRRSPEDRQDDPEARVRHLAKRLDKFILILILLIVVVYLILVFVNF